MFCRSRLVAATLTKRVMQRGSRISSPVRSNRWFSSSTTTPEYHIEVSNAARPGVTQIVITGPGVLGLLASMCCSLANMNGSIKSLHAVDSRAEDGVVNNATSKKDKPIRDIITVVDYGTGKAFKDEELPAVAEAVLKSTKAPLQVVSIVQEELGKRNLDDVDWKGKATVFAEKDFVRL